MEEILYRAYSNEADLPEIMALVQNELSEPYVIYTYRYFLHQWPHLSYIAYTKASPSLIGVVVSKQDIHKGKINRGYIAMLSVSREWRKRGIASNLVRLSMSAMHHNGAEEVMLETEHDNDAALSLYASLGFIREKRLYRFYMSGKDAFRLVLPLEPINGSIYPIQSSAASKEDFSVQPDRGTTVEDHDLTQTTNQALLDESRAGHATNPNHRYSTTNLVSSHHLGDTRNIQISSLVHISVP